MEVVNFEIDSFQKHKKTWLLTISRETVYIITNNNYGKILTMKEPIRMPSLTSRLHVPCHKIMIPIDCFNNDGIYILVQ